MKRYLLFAGENYYPLGGWEDFKGSFDSIEDAKAAFAPGDDDWAHIVDSGTMNLVLAWAIVDRRVHPRERKKDWVPQQPHQTVRG